MQNVHKILISMGRQECISDFPKFIPEKIRIVDDLGIEFEVTIVLYEDLEREEPFAATGSLCLDYNGPDGWRVYVHDGLEFVCTCRDEIGLHEGLEVLNLLHGKHIDEVNEYFEKLAR